MRIDLSPTECEIIIKALCHTASVFEETVDSFAFQSGPRDCADRIKHEAERMVEIADHIDQQLD